MTGRVPAALASPLVALALAGCAGALVREDTWVLNLVCAPDAASDVAILGLVEACKTRFAQQSVLRVSTLACVAF